MANGWYPLETKLEVLAAYDKILEENGPRIGNMAKAAKQFSIGRRCVSKWVNDRHALSISNVGKSWTKEESAKLRKLRLKHPGPNDWDPISKEMRRGVKSCKTKYEELVVEDQCISAEQFRNIPVELLDLLKAKLVDGANVFETLTHASYIGPDWFVEMTDEMVEPFIERFKEDSKREPGSSGIAIIESAVGKRTLLPDIVVREEINFDAHKQCSLPHIRNPKPPHALRKTVHPYVYANDSFMKAINKQINSNERRKWYGRGAEYDEHLFLSFITAQANKDLLFKSAGMSTNCTHEGFFKTIFPVEICHCYKMTFIGNDIKDATFDRIN